MSYGGEMVLVIVALGLAIFIQLQASKMRSSILGLILPFLLFVISVCIFFADLQNIWKGRDESLNAVTATLYFALYNIPTILFLCIYNYYKRTRIVKGNKKSGD